MIVHQALDLRSPCLQVLHLVKKEESWPPLVRRHVEGRGQHFPLVPARDGQHGLVEVAQRRQLVEGDVQDALGIHGLGNETFDDLPQQHRLADPSWAAKHGSRCHPMAQQVLEASEGPAPEGRERGPRLPPPPGIERSQVVNEVEWKHAPAFHWSRSAAARTCCSSTMTPPRACTSRALKGCRTRSRRGCGVPQSNTT